MSVTERRRARRMQLSVLGSSETMMRKSAD